MLLKFDDDQTMKIIFQGPQCHKWFLPRPETEDINDRLIGWNQLCLTMAKAETYSVSIDYQLAFHESQLCWSS
mgnify:FL=1